MSKLFYFILFIYKIYYLKSVHLYADFLSHPPVLNVYSKNTKTMTIFMSISKICIKNHTNLSHGGFNIYILYLCVWCGKCNHPIERCLTFRFDFKQSWVILLSYAEDVAVISS